jgi:hypothetical protein
LIAATSFHTQKKCDSSGFCLDEANFDGGQFAIGLGVTLASTIVGIILAAQPDKAEISVVPMQAGSLRRLEGAAARGALAEPQGAALQVRF